MVRCPVCTSEPLVCRGEACLEPFTCNVAGRCSMPPREAWDWEALEPGGAGVVVPHEHAVAAQREAHRTAERSGYRLQFATKTLPEGMRVWRVR